MNWEIICADGSTICEGDSGTQNFNVLCSEHRVAAIAFEGDGRRYALDVPDGAVPFARRRHAVAWSASGAQTDAIAAHILGWHTDTDAEYLFILPDGSVRESKTLEGVTL